MKRISILLCSSILAAGSLCVAETPAFQELKVLHDIPRPEVEVVLCIMLQSSQTTVPKVHFVGL